MLTVVCAYLLIGALALLMAFIIFIFGGGAK